MAKEILLSSALAQGIGLWPEMAASVVCIYVCHTFGMQCEMLCD